MSASARRRAIVASMRREPRISAGRGGSGPLASSLSPGTPVSCSGGTSSCDRIMLVRPASLFRSKSVCSVGRRRSQSTRMTRCSAWAIVTARFASVVDLPSSGAVLVTNSVCSGLSRLENWMLVRSVRYASEAGARGSRREISGDVPFDGAVIASLQIGSYVLRFTSQCSDTVGIAPSVVSPTKRSTSADDLSESSSASIAKASSRPRISPSTRPASTLMRVCGR